MHEATLYSREEGYVLCGLCAHRCKIKDGRVGRCGVRENREGRLYSLVYGQLVAEHVDPIEKKPLFHFLPASRSYSIATRGCNFRCLHCQNYSLSQMRHGESREVLAAVTQPQRVVASALEHGCQSISYTYVEPTIFWEYGADCCALAREQGLKNIFVSNGYMTKEAAMQMIPLLDAINIDVKAFRDEFYRDICGARLQPVLDSVHRMYDGGVWVEITTLVIPGLNDSAEELGQIAEFIASVSVDIPWHVTAFYPTYKMTDRGATPASTLARARALGLDAGLHHVYEGNIPGAGGENSSCPCCGALVIGRHGFRIEDNRLVDGCCPDCGEQIRGIWR